MALKQLVTIKGKHLLLISVLILTIFDNFDHFTRDFLRITLEIQTLKFDHFYKL